jgi:hypothetical protein
MLGIWKSSNKNWASAVKGKNALTKLGDDSGKRLFLPQNLGGFTTFWVGLFCVVLEIYKEYAAQ